ncbi:hypothetical protein [Undibacterium sp. Ren11W]|uniref:hypothetical protein n=1 Tax=Undibacterium sp. Ren11W TaxID=3413045 RepID=UPI003BF1B744
MKFIGAFFVFVTSLSSFAFVSCESKWIPMKPYKFDAEDKDALNIAKNWAASEFNTKEGKYDFKYSIRKLDTGFRMQVTPRYKNSDGKYLYELHADMCFDLDRERKLVQVFHCRLPPFEALQRR